VQSKTSWRIKIGTDGSDADDAWIPAHAGANQKAVFRRVVFQYLAELGFHALSRESSRVADQLVEACTLKRCHSELCEYLLLPNAT
jgi:hypothetical protein